MNTLILMGSPRLHGNTAELCKPLMEELRAQGVQVRYVTLADRDIRPCRACYRCQDVEGAYGCVQQYGMAAVVEDILWADLIVLATPIYSWYCTPQMKAVLERHYGLNKYYGKAKGSLWAGKHVAILATHGYESEYAYGPFETGVQRLCEHSKLVYDGLYSVVDEDNLASFRTPEAIEGARAFARRLVEAVQVDRGGL